ncbi:MAG: alpha-L-arabinofuranosidase C-terminal domain-containing protein [Caldilineaceae bacterium]
MERRSLRADRLRRQPQPERRPAHQRRRPRLRRLPRVEHITLTHPDLKAVNTQDNPDNVSPRSNGDAQIVDNELRASLPAASWNVIRMKK